MPLLAKIMNFFGDEARMDRKIDAYNELLAAYCLAMDGDDIEDLKESAAGLAVKYGHHESVRDLLIDSLEIVADHMSPPYGHAHELAAAIAAGAAKGNLTTDSGGDKKTSEARLKLEEEAAMLWHKYFTIDFEAEREEARFFEESADEANRFYAARATNIIYYSPAHKMRDLAQGFLNQRKLDKAEPSASQLQL